MDERRAIKSLMRVGTSDVRQWTRDELERVDATLELVPSELTALTLKGRKCHGEAKTRSSLEVSAIGLGCMGMSDGYGPPATETGMIALIRAAVEHGVTFFDTAEVYGPFTNEELVGEALAPVRDQVVIATKFGFDIDGRQSAAARTAGRSASGEVVEGSLKRLRTDRSTCSTSTASTRGPDRGRRRHRQGPHRGGQGEALRPLRGRRRDDPPRARRPAGDRPAERILAVVARARGRDPADAARSSGIGFVPFSPLGKGFLTGEIDETRRSTRATSAATSPLHAGDTAAQPGARRPAAARSPSARGPRRRRSRSPGCSRRRLDRADPRHDEAAPAGGEPRAASIVGSPPTNCERSTTRRPRLRALGTRKRPSG